MTVSQEKPLRVETDMNDNNVAFYRKIKIDRFREIAALLGFHTGIDLDVLLPHIRHAKVLIELGVGFGRVIKALLDRDFGGKIIGIERSPELFQFLKTQFPPSVQLFEQNIRHFEIGQNADAILYMWSGILELSLHEQHEAVRHFSQKLNPKGILVLEIPRQVKYMGVSVGNQNLKVETEWGVLDAFLPTHEQMLELVEIGGFESLKVIDYQTVADLSRAMYLYQKS